MQQPDHNSAPYYQYPSNPNPNNTFQPSSTYASAPPFSSNYLTPDHHPSSSYPPTYPPYPLNPDPIPSVPPTAASYNPNPNPNLQQFAPNSLSSLDQCGQPYQPPAQQHSYYPQFDQQRTGPTYASPNPNPSYSSAYIGSSVPIPPVHENRCESNNSKFDQFGGTYGRSRSVVGSEMYGNPSDSGISRFDSVSGLGGDGYGFSDGIYAYQGSKKEPYGARGTGTKSSTWSGFDDFGRPISSPTRKDSFLAPTKVVRAVPKADTQQDVKSGIQKFRVKLLAESGGQSTLDVLCQIGLDGIRMLDPNTSRTLRIYPLENITRFEVLDSTIFAFWAKSSVDIEPRRIRLKSNSYTSNTILDIVTAATIQFKEMGGRSKPSDFLKPVEQPPEKKKGLGDWMNLIKPGNEEKDHWVPDEAVSKCTLCGTDFSAFVRKHHCRNCGDIFCDKCTHGRIALTAEENAQPVRVCDRCLAEVTQRLNIAKEATSRSAGSLQSHEDLAKKLQEEMERNRKVSSGFRSDGSSRRMKEVACPTCTVHLQVQVPSSGSETIECGVCQHPFVVSAR